MYNEFDPKHYKGKWPCTTKTLYNEKTLIGRLHQYFLIYFETFSVPTADTLFLLILSILTLESAHSIRFLYQHFLSGITEKSLNVFYYACSYAKVDYSRFMNTTVRIVLKLIPDSLQTQPVFLCVDDTMVSKFGTKFENVSKLFDHAAHNGSNYLNGHCFVNIMLCIPVWKNDRMKHIPLFLYSFRWNIIPISALGILKQATMNRKRSGLFVTIWCEAAKGLKCLSIWLTSVTVPWRFCPIRTNIFLSTVQKAYRSFVLN